MALFSCSASREFANKVVDEFNKIRYPEENELHLGASVVTQFSDGEFQPSFTESVRGATVFILQSTFPPAENLMELLLSIDAAKRASADKVIAVMPYFGWARQDRKDKPRVSIGAKLVANLLKAAGADRVMTCDLHAEQIQGFFDFPVDHLYGSKVFIPLIKSLNLENLSIAAPDMGGAKRANVYAKELACPVIICHKSREKANEVASITAIGEVEGRNIIIVDDNRAVISDSLFVLEEVMPNATITGFNGPRKAIEYAKVNRIDLAILDIELGTASGLDLCRTLLEINPRTNVVFLTAYADYSLNAWGTEASGFMLKPMTPEGVREQLKKLRYPFSTGGAGE